MTQHTVNDTLDHEYEKALIEIIAEARRQSREGKHTLIQYAATYAAAGRGMTGEERRVQCLYILNNLATWRGPEARNVKETLRQFTRRK